ncbi:hypothetical protein SARC_01036 [Sphaeroforma arctica JP610]|uniref:Uncharacterized protein n=1 Tax=Sphaeroforma arctica JP610 TaxID=667725 RepID=A0A0L0GEX0_9EUKA|nr:hypothetical protein SARC_01036 [Sphaeroforma arctica JP610]KNC86843.1 hypothetical protein SARC_01036 [Sphaeroforma arctica JP610]|eukprot:XP_014160745.1 hypothetical protein SARC_01036 [Sphaeroforma arctica JP610]
MRSIWKEDAHRHTFKHVPSTGQVSCVVGGDVYVLGGRAMPTSLENCICKYNLDRRKWVAVEVIGEMPDGFWSGAVALAVDDIIYVYGGHRVSYGYQASMHKYDIRTQIWSVIQTGGIVPSPRDKHAGVVYDGNLYYFGGWGQVTSGFTWAGELWKYDIIANKWSLVCTKGQPPSPRAAHTMTLMPGTDAHAYVIGGRCKDGRNNEVYRLDMSIMHWTGPLVANTAVSSYSLRIAPSGKGSAETVAREPTTRKRLEMNGSAPEHESIRDYRRRSMAMNTVADIVRSSSHVGEVVLNGAHVSDPAGDMVGNASHEKPCGRSWHTAQYLDSRRILVHGGMSNGVGLEVGTPQLTVNGGPGHALGDTWVFNVGTYKWSCVETTGQARLWHSSCVDRDKGEVLYFSGHSNFEHGVLRDVTNDVVARFQYMPLPLSRIASDLVASTLNAQARGTSGKMGTDGNVRRSAEDVLRVEVRRGSMSAKAAVQISERIKATSVEEPQRLVSVSTGHMRSVWDVRHRLTV